MPKPSTVSTDCIVLNIQPHGEKFQKVRLLSIHLGSAYGLYRIPKKNHDRPLLDLFDNAHFLLQPNKENPNTYFIEDYHHIGRHLSIGRHYTSLQYASQWVTILAKNIDCMHNAYEIYDLCLQTLQAFARYQYPEAIFLKSIYRLVSTEGFPVKQDWLNQLETTLQHSAKDILFNKIEKIEETPQKACYLIEKLTQWIQQETPIIF